MKIKHDRIRNRYYYKLIGEITGKSKKAIAQAMLRKGIKKDIDGFAIYLINYFYDKKRNTIKKDDKRKGDSL